MPRHFSGLGGLAGDFSEGLGELIFLAAAFDIDGTAVSCLFEDTEERAEVIACDAGVGSVFFFGDFNVGDNVHRLFEVLRGVTGAGDVEEIGEDADVRMARGADQPGGVADVVEEVALGRLELLDGDGDAVVCGERPHAFEQGDELVVGLGFFPASGEFA